MRKLRVLVLRIQTDHPHACFPHDGQDQLQKIGFSLPGITKNQDVGIGFVLCSLVKIHQNVAAILVLADIKSISVCLSRVVKGKEIRHTAGRQHPLILLTKSVLPHRIY